MSVSYSDFARGLKVETAFTVLAEARRLKALGKRIVELEIGDSPFPSTPAAKAAGIAAIEANETRYCPSAGLEKFRAAAADFVRREYGIEARAENIVAGHGAKVFELLFCEAFLNPGDGVLVFSPFFPTYPPNIARRGARLVLADLKQEHEFRPQAEDVERFLATDPRPKAIFLNSPHNPTGGVASESDLAAIADLVRGRDVAVFSDEPYDRMVWRGRHHSIAAQPRLLDQCVAGYTFSKSYSMSGWRIGFAVAGRATADVLSGLVNTSLSCVPPLAQLAATAALERDAGERDENMRRFERQVRLLVAGLNQIEGLRCLEPAGTFYAFPNVKPICNRLGITSHGLALYLLAGADDEFGVACLGGESFGAAGGGFLRFSCAETDELIEQAVRFLPDAFNRVDRVKRYLADHPEHRLAQPYAE